MRISFHYARLRGHDELEFNGRFAGHRAVGGRDLAIQAIGVRSHGRSPGIDEIATGVIEQANPIVTVRHARVQGLGDGDGVNVQTHVRGPRESHGLRALHRLRPGGVQRPFG